jgi:hypothetical protein
MVSEKVKGVLVPHKIQRSLRGNEEESKSMLEIQDPRRVDLCDTI